ncbi:MAG: UDP-N-acetylglucosamine 4,6-dehydratase (inverting), partial [Lachnospiraceae bacterium]|nr:UDP-N-acetylglucosamine 4,6-dehydratase (inverting) [Lachnospiraceae bacterium]
PGEKLDEVMVTPEDAPFTWEYENHFVIYPQVTFNEWQVPAPGGKQVPEGFSYNSGNNTEWLSVEDIRERLKTDLHS